MRIAVAGLGLIGGSIGLAARARQGARVTGYDPEPGALERALQLGAIDEPAPDIAAASAHADAVFVAAPVAALPDAIAQALRAAPAGCVVSDVGSTKLELARRGFDERFIGGHPLAGAETAGIEHAREDLFEGATWYLTPTQRTPADLRGTLEGLLRVLGARPTEIDAALHDRLMASVSHLPHVFANLLAVAAAQAPGAGPASLGPSFRDATRVAGANSAIWTDIYLSNREPLLDAIDDAAGRLAQVRAWLQDRDARALGAWHRQAFADRARLEAGDATGREPAPGDR